MTDILVDDTYLYAINNLNYNTYVSRIEKSGKKNDVVTFENEVTLNICFYNNKLYRMCTDYNTQEFFLKEVDFEKNEDGKGKIDLSKYVNEEHEPSYFEEYKGKLYIPTGDKLLCVENENITVNQIDVIANTEAWGLYKSNNYLYISVCSRFGQSDKSKIIKYNMDNDKEEEVYEIDSAIMQFQVSTNEIVVLSSEKDLIKYELNEEGKIVNKIVKTNEEGENSYISAFYIKD